MRHSTGSLNSGILVYQAKVDISLPFSTWEDTPSVDVGSNMMARGDATCLDRMLVFTYVAANRNKLAPSSRNKVYRPHHSLDREGRSGRATSVLRGRNRRVLECMCNVIMRALPPLSSRRTTPSILKAPPTINHTPYFPLLGSKLERPFAKTAPSCCGGGNNSSATPTMGNLSMT